MNHLPLDMTGNGVNVTAGRMGQRNIAQKSRKVGEHCLLAITAHL